MIASNDKAFGTRANKLLFQMSVVFMPIYKDLT